MNKTEQAQAHWAVMNDPTRSKVEQRAAGDELSTLKLKAKVSWAKLGLDQELIADWKAEGTDEEPFEASEEELKAQTLRPVADDPLEEAPVELPQPIEAPKAAKAARKPKKAPDGDRGLISAEIKRLLTDTEAPYAEIVEKVCGMFPKAVTTTRSVASVASEMRAKGTVVPTRRVAAKVKA